MSGAASIMLGFLATLVLLVVRSLLVDELRGQFQRCISARVDATIAGLPQVLQDEWGDEWRAELAASIAMPLTALKFAYGLPRSARELVGDFSAALDSTNDETPQGAGADDGQNLTILVDENVAPQALHLIVKELARETIDVAPGARMLTPTELARETGLDRRDVISRCMDLGVPIFRGRIDKTLFVTSHNATRRAP